MFHSLTWSDLIFPFFPLSNVCLLCLVPQQVFCPNGTSAIVEISKLYFSFHLHRWE